MTQLNFFSFFSQVQISHSSCRNTLYSRCRNQINNGQNCVVFSCLLSTYRVTGMFLKRSEGGRRPTERSVFNFFSHIDYFLVKISSYVENQIASKTHISKAQPKDFLEGTLLSDVPWDVFPKTRCCHLLIAGSKPWRPAPLNMDKLQGSTGCSELFMMLRLLAVGNYASFPTLRGHFSLKSISPPHSLSLMM